jgi:hypothetical protein
LLEHNGGNGFQLVLNILNQRALPILKKASQQGFGVMQGCRYSLDCLQASFILIQYFLPMIIGIVD